MAVLRNRTKETTRNTESQVTGSSDVCGKLCLHAAVVMIQKLVSQNYYMQIHQITRIGWKGRETGPLQPLPVLNLSNEPSLVFSLPQSVLEEYHPPNLAHRVPKPPRKRGEHHLEGVAPASQMRQIYRPIRRHKSVLDTPLMQLPDSPSKSKPKKVPKMHSTISTTMKILDRVIFEAEERPRIKETDMQLNASRLPMIIKKQSTRRQSIAAFQAKYFTIQREEARQAREVKQARETSYYKDQIVPIRPKKIEKPFLCGWELPEGAD